jgi:hypothetical protein
MFNQGRLVGQPRQSGSRRGRGWHGVWCLKAGVWGQTGGMGIGVGIFLLALGAILTFAVDWTVGGLDLNAVGWVLMAAGVAGLVLFFYFWNRRRSPASVVAPPPPGEVSRMYDDAPPPVR